MSTAWPSWVVVFPDAHLAVDDHSGPFQPHAQLVGEPRAERDQQPHRGGVGLPQQLLDQAGQRLAPPPGTGHSSNLSSTRVTWSAASVTSAIGTKTTWRCPPPSRREADRRWSPGPSSSPHRARPAERTRRPRREPPP